jgi:uncharacterized protein (TIGR02246 family)
MTPPSSAVISAPDAKARIEAIIAALAETWNRHDMAGFASHFSENADFVNVVGMHLRGRAAIEAQHIAIHQTVFRNSRIQSLHHTIRFLTPEVAIAHVNWRMDGHDMSMTQGWQTDAVRQGVYTAVLMPEDGIWHITALHNTDTVSVHGPGK